ncbi:MAG: VCBS repeat-containing protein [Bryobacterales bacterium]|jgi:hypothetical protein|nr:VCBS repeat-containing protein [Bryobacterales bacterium]
MRRYWIPPLISLLSLCAFAASRPADIPFRIHTLDIGASETAAVADVNGDGKPDIVSGEYWYEGPSWKPHRFREVHFQNNYVDAFSDLPLDVDGDGLVDIITCTWFSKKMSWYRNPGKAGGPWRESLISQGHNTEFCFLVDMDNDGAAREVLPQYGGKTSPTAWYEYKGGQWVQHVMSAKNFGHGIGAGDLNGDGRIDILHKTGWLEAPADPRSGEWKEHQAWSFEEHLSFMHVEDVNGDGKSDVIFGNAHDYGLFWLENLGEGKWQKREIDRAWSQVHPVTLVDLNGDGKLDIVTGKRFLAHDHDPGAQDPNGLFWYQRIPTPDGKGVAWVRHILSYGGAIGGGMQMPVADVDGDGDLDIVAPGKGGLYLLENLTKGGRK